MKDNGIISTHTFEKQAGEKHAKKKSRWGLFTGDDLGAGVLADLIIYDRTGKIRDRLSMSKHDLEMLKKACEETLSE